MYVIIKTSILAYFFYVLAVCDCPNGYMRHDDSCYKLYASTKASWAEAFASFKIHNIYMLIYYYVTNTKYSYELLYTFYFRFL